MKFLLCLVALHSVAAAAGEVRLGLDFALDASIPAFSKIPSDPSIPLTSAGQTGYGAMIIPALSYAMSDRASIRVGFGYELLQFGLTQSSSSSNGSAQIGRSYGEEFLTYDFAFQYAFVPSLFAAIGARKDFDFGFGWAPLHVGFGTGPIERGNPWSLDIGVGYGVSKGLSIMLGYHFPVTGIEEIEGQGTPYETVTKLKLDVVTLGGRYDFRL